MDKPSRREFFKRSGGIAAGVGAMTVGVGSAGAVTADAGRTTLPYKPQRIANAKSLKPNTPLSFTFPDQSSPCTLLKLGRPVPGGVGPEKDIVAYSLVQGDVGWHTEGRRR